MGTFRRLLGFLRPYRRLWAISFALALLAMSATVISPALIGRAIDRIRGGDESGLRDIAIALALFGLGRMGLTVGRRLVAGRVSLGVEQDLRDRLYGHLQALELGFFDRWQTGQLMSRATVDLSAVRFFLGYGLVFVVQSLLTVVLAAIAMTIQQPLLTLACLLPAPLIVLVGHAYGTRGRPAQQDAQQAVAEVTAAAEESISGIRVVKAFAAEGRREAAFSAAVDHAFARQLRAVRIDASFQPVVQFLPQISLAIVLLVGGRMVVSDDITVGQFTAFFVYVMMLVQPLRSLGVMLGLGQRATASGARLFEVLDREPAIVAPAPDRLRTLPAGAHGPIGAVELEDVTLRYPGQDTPALQDVSLSVRAGERVAIVGQTGSGKTALVQLLPRLYDPVAGRVLVDGIDVRDLDPTALRHEIAIVDDDPFLFTATVAENIAYAAPGATREEVEEAARRARADDFVRALPDGYDTVVGERGLTLSGGQRQRLAIARALLAGPRPGAGADGRPARGRGPRILVLDDATSNVDASTEQGITAALREVMEDRTTLVIAHRLSTVLLADRVVVLHQGRVVDVGVHAELLERSELYREIVTYGLADQVFLSREERPTEVQEA